MKDRLRDLLFDADAQVYFSAGLMAVAIILWPISQLTFARKEPPTVLGLSWLALIFAAYAALVAALGNKSK